MKINKTKIEGLYLIEGFAFSDNRGSLIKPFSLSFFDNNFDDNLHFKEVWFTKSSKNVIRAMHLQIGEFACEKLVSVINGAVLDVVLDLRTQSSTFGQWFEIELNDVNNYAIYIPKGCAHGYKVIKDNSITLYMGTEINVPKADVGIRWDSFGYDWDIDNPILSEKDKSLIEFKDYK
jgi:dTDP-4-dehydrorhamnose 3,5-epimerase